MMFATSRFNCRPIQILSKYHYLLPKILTVLTLAGIFSLMIIIREGRTDYIATPFVRPWIGYIPVLTTCYPIQDPLHDINNQQIDEKQLPIEEETHIATALQSRVRPFIGEFKNPCYLLRDEDKIFGNVLAPSRTNSTKQGLASIQFIDYKSHNLSVGNLRCLPYYFVLGFAKCATEDMFAKMMAHPHILRHEKEPQWISNRRFKGNPSSTFLSDYADSFDRTASHPIAAYYQRYGTRVPLIIGDHSTHTIDSWKGYRQNIAYNSTPPDRPSNHTLQRFSSPALIKAVLPNAKFIIVVREPISRIFSLYKFHHAKSREDFHNGVVNGIAWWNLCLKEGFPVQRCLWDVPRLNAFKAVKPCSWQPQATNSLRRGLYYLFIQEWLDVFPREQFLILRFDDYVRNTSLIINNVVFPFLELPKLSGFNEMSLNARFGFHLDSFRYVKKASGRREFRFTAWDKGDMLPETKALLTDFYADSKIELAQLLQDNAYLWN